MLWAKFVGDIFIACQFVQTANNQHAYIKNPTMTKRKFCGKKRFFSFPAANATQRPHIYFMQDAPEIVLTLCFLFIYLLTAMLCSWKIVDVIILCSGYLYVSNVLPSDDRHGHKYVCIANNWVLGAHVQGQDQRVEPVEKPGKVEPETLR